MELFSLYEDVNSIADKTAMLEHEQRLIDARAAVVEKRLRRAMEPDATETEEEILKEWFALVDKRNAIIQELDKLNNLGKESDLEARQEKLNHETLMAAKILEDLRNSIGEDSVLRRAPEDRVLRTVSDDTLLSVFSRFTRFPGALHVE